jgi:predicted TIM-barrel fold metal-dependent hydrolase
MIVDVNVSLSRWPFRRLACDEPHALVEKLREQGVSQAWCGSFDALLHRDMAGVNIRLVEACQQHGDGLLVPFGAIDPMLPDWEEDLRRCQEVHHMPGIRLHPNYHGYKLDDPQFERLVRLAAERKLIVQIAVIMEDDRTQHPLVQVPPVDVAPLVKLVESLPGLRIVLLNAHRNVRADLRQKLVAAGQVYFDIATLEGVGGVEKLLVELPMERILLGSHFPLFYFESAVLKLQESPLAGGQIEAIRQGNARRLLGAE